MRWIGNITAPAHALARARIVPRVGQTPDEAIAERAAWLAGKVLGEPMPQPGWTVERLKRAGIVGVYEPGDEQPAAADVAA